jgi:hypothetical protein
MAANSYPTFDELLEYFGGVANTHKALADAYFGNAGLLPAEWRWDDLLTHFYSQQMAQTHLLERIAMDLEEIIDWMRGRNDAAV